MNPAQGTVIGNRFRLVRELGRGAMGAVWLADHLTLGVPCAVKIIVDQWLADPDIRARFHAEAHAVARVQSANVVRILDYDVCDDVPFIAMEFLDGEDLRTRLQRVGRLGAQGTHRIVSQVARGLAKAHAAGIVHRDLKPENVFVANEDGVEVAKLLDFGIAKLASCPMLDANIQVGALVGSPNYMSPEQACGVREIDRRSDLWSLGVIAYECLTGLRPFEGETVTDLLAEVMAGRIPIPSELDPDLPAAFDEWWARAAARDPDQRYQNASELADALAVALGFAEPNAAGSEPPSAMPPVFDLERLRAPTLPGSTLVMSRSQLTRCEPRRAGPRQHRLLAFAATLTIAMVAGALLDVDHARQVAARSRPADAVVLTPSVPEARVEAVPGPPVRVAAKQLVNPAPRPAPDVARPSSRFAPHAPMQRPKQPVEEIDFGI